MRKSILLAFVLWLGFAPTAASGEEASRFVGTWKLLWIEDDRGNQSRGEKPIGVIYYDAAGNMAAQIMPDRPRATWSPGDSPTPEQAKDAISGYTAYFGTCTVDEKNRTVSHHRAGSLAPGAVGLDAVRRYEFASGGRLILTPVEYPKMRLTWERVR